MGLAGSTSTITTNSDNRNKMRSIKSATLLLALLVFACNKKADKDAPEIVQEKTLPNPANDPAELEKLTKELYKWNETKSSGTDFDPLQIEKTDTIYKKLDLKRHKQRIKELRETNLFASQFIENYDKIAMAINEKMKNGTFKWATGELPPFGNGTNPWCACQDSPDNYWKKITLKNIAFNGNNATYAWTWGDGSAYKAEAVKEDGVWKISYLQGFDFNELAEQK
ncbi:MAG TPA: hypothetical protein VFR70_09710 [Flavobacterium sp.]|nr:hypothetical protein [Flavobacterium sp.]